jgi:hypothetical protein
MYDIYCSSSTLTNTSLVQYRKTGSTDWLPSTTVYINNMISLVLSESSYVKGDTIPYSLYTDKAGSPVKTADIICTSNGSIKSGSNYTAGDSVWQYNNKLVVHGDAIIDGTLSVKAIKGGDITTGLSFYLNHTDYAAFPMAIYGKNTNTSGVGTGGLGYYGLAGVGTETSGAGVIASFGGLTDNYTTNAAFLATANWSGDFRNGLTVASGVGTGGAGGTNRVNLGTSTHAGTFDGAVTVRSQHVVRVVSFSGGTLKLAGDA